METADRASLIRKIKVSLMRIHRIVRSTHGLFIAAGATSLVGCSGAQSGSTVSAGTARFEFLTPTLLRMEYSPTGTFVDAPTAAVQKRSWPAVEVRSTRKNGWLIAASTAVTVRYRLESGPFTAINLKVSWNDPVGAPHEWHPGEEDRRNLGGLTYSLDNISTASVPEGQMDLESPVNDVNPGIELMLEGSGHLVSRRVVRRDENDRVYDLTERFLAQADAFPYCQKKDIIDAVSRIYDMEVRAPALIEQGTLEPEYL